MSDDSTILYELETVILLKDVDIQTPNGTSLTINGDEIGSGGGEPVGLPDPTGQTGTFLGVTGGEGSEVYSLEPIIIPASVVIQYYDDVNDAREDAAQVIWIPLDPELDEPVNKTVDDAVIYSQSIEMLMFALSDETTAITTGTGKLVVRAPFQLILTEVRASLTTASSSGAVTIDINDSGTTIFSTPLTIDQGETTSVTAATPAVISDINIADDAQLRFDIDGAGTGATGLKVYLYFLRA